MRCAMLVGTLTLALAAPAAAQDSVPLPTPKVNLQEVGHSLHGMDLVYAELRDALRQRDSIYEALTAAILAIPDPTRDTPRADLEAAIRTARAEATRARGEVAPIGPRVEAFHLRYGELSAIARARYEAVLDVLDRK